MFHTLHDFTLHAKGLSYLMAGLLMLAFIPFWFFIVKKSTRDKKK